MIYKDEELGSMMFKIGDHQVRRSEFRMKNRKEQELFGSFYSLANNPAGKPCIVYLHSSHGCRIENLAIIHLLIPDFTLCVYDLASRGMSAGLYLTYGHQEWNDLEGIIDCLKDRFHAEEFFLWGRDVGASTVIKFARFSNDRKDVLGLCLDSPYSKFEDYVKTIS